MNECANFDLNWPGLGLLWPQILSTESRQEKVHFLTYNHFSVPNSWALQLWNFYIHTLFLIGSGLGFLNHCIICLLELVVSMVGFGFSIFWIGPDLVQNWINTK